MKKFITALILFFATPIAVLADFISGPKTSVPTVWADVVLGPDLRGEKVSASGELPYEIIIPVAVLILAVVVVLAISRYKKRK